MKKRLQIQTIRFKKKVNLLKPSITNKEIKLFWENFYYSSVFSGQKRKSKNPVKYQSYVTSNKPLSEFQADLLTPPEFLKKDKNYKLILLVVDVIRYIKDKIFKTNDLLLKIFSKNCFYNFIKDKKEIEIKRAFGNICQDINTSKKQIVLDDDEITIYTDFGQVNCLIV